MKRFVHSLVLGYDDILSTCGYRRKSMKNNINGKIMKLLFPGAMLWLGLVAQSIIAAPAGTWTGTYIGSDHGTVTITIDSYEAATCDFHSATGQDHKLAGSLVNGIIVSCSSPEPSSYSSAVNWWTATGSVDTDTGTISGTWVTGQASYQGSFTATLSSGGSGSSGGGGTTTPLTTTPQGVTGMWYDPAYEGSGFNVLMSGSGLIFYYYGWDNNHNRLWLFSDIGPAQITSGTAITLAMHETNGGSFPTPAPSSTGTPWGTLKINFSSCNAATATLSGADGDTTLDLQKLAGIGGNLIPGC